MSSRDHPDLLSAYPQQAQAAGVPSDLDHILVLPRFELGFEQPQFQSSPREDPATLVPQILQVLTDTHPLPPEPGGNLLSQFPAEGRTRILRFDLDSGTGS